MFKCEVLPTREVFQWPGKGSELNILLPQMAMKRELSASRCPICEACGEGFCEAGAQA